MRRPAKTESRSVLSIYALGEAGNEKTGKKELRSAWVYIRWGRLEIYHVIRKKSLTRIVPLLHLLFFLCSRDHFCCSQVTLFFS